MGIYKSAQGKSVDMGALAKKNELVRAVGNGSVNARGDTIDARGRIVEPVNNKVGKTYNKTVANKSAQAPKKQAPIAKPPEINAAERELEEEDAEELALEQAAKAKK